MGELEATQVRNRIGDVESPLEMRKYEAEIDVEEGGACGSELHQRRSAPRREDQRGKEKGFPDRRVAYRATHFI